MSKDEQSFHKVMVIMFPIRNALMCDSKAYQKIIDSNSLTNLEREA